MLGQITHAAPLDKEESKKIRMVAYRMATGNLTEEDRKQVAHYNKLRTDPRVCFVWK